LILERWLSGRLTVVASQEIIDEYRAVVRRLQKKSNVDVVRLVERLLMLVKYVMPPTLPQQICKDPDDDKFIAAAISGRVPYIVTGDKALLDVGRVRKIQIVTPSAFASRTS